MCLVTETAVQAQAHEIKEDWKPSFLSNDEFMHLMLEVLIYIPVILKFIHCLVEMDKIFMILL